MTTRCKSCGSCGMPMEKNEDFALGNTSSDYCRYCTDKVGKLLPFARILQMNADYLVESQGVTPEAAQKMASEMLKKLPAWQNH